ncbi:MAG: CHRD domain-containing protein [Verrucomicrobiales bacterium]|nr:CHRD domain-containing protein [Verrucomicrobiales bacterium]
MHSRTLKGLAVACSILVASPLVFAHQIVYTANLKGSIEAPPNASPATGFARVTVDLDLDTMRIEADFQHLLGTTIASHIHAATPAPDSGTAGVATQVPFFTGFPLGVTSGTYDHVFNLSTASFYSPSFISNTGGTVSGAREYLLWSLDEGRAYLNIHTSLFSAGEIRGFFHRVPDTAPVLALFAPMVVALAGLRWATHRS